MEYDRKEMWRPSFALRRSLGGQIVMELLRPGKGFGPKGGD